MDSKELGRLTMKRRKELKLSQEDVAVRAGLSRNYISLIERGETPNVSVNVLNRLALALDTTPAWLSGQTDATDILIPATLREFGRTEGLSFEVVERLARIPRRGQEPQTVEQWRKVWKVVKPYLEEAD
jgi:transcriptional regulator with XRE-family HTH domain